MNLDLGSLCHGAKSDKINENDFSLDAIAKLHLSSSNESNIPNLDFGAKWDFKKIELKEEPTGGNSLDALAKLHLDSQDSSSTPSFLFKPLSDLGLSFSSGTSANAPKLNFNSQVGEGKENALQFKNLGELKPTPLLKKEETKGHVKTGFQIDLTSALLQNTCIKSQSMPKIVKLKAETSYVKPYDILEEILLISESFGSRKSPIKVLSRPSKAGLVLCRQWARKPSNVPVQKTSLSVPKITPFSFDTPSPDDVIKTAQSNLMYRHQK